MNSSLGLLPLCLKAGTEKEQKNIESLKKSHQLWERLLMCRQWFLETLEKTVALVLHLQETLLPVKMFFLESGCQTLKVKMSLQELEHPIQ